VALRFAIALNMPVRNIERELELLAEVRKLASSEQRDRVLRKALTDKVNVIVAKAAALTGELQAHTLLPDLCSAFERLLKDPLKSDPKCWGKEAIAKSLKDLGHSDSAIFVKGVHHVQLEPVWGGEEDTAATLRATCALAMLQCTDLTREDKLWAVMPLLTEKSASVRKDAAMALESLEGREAALLLRIKARMGDNDATVTGQVFESLLRVEREGAVPFVAEFFRELDAEVRDEAVLALGASRLPEGVAALRDLFARKMPLVDPEVVFRALSISRREEAIDFLLDVIRTRRPREVFAALDALKVYRDSSEVRKRISDAVSVRSEREIQQEFHRLFSTSTEPGA
jgi:HEAT repeat protein